MRWKLIVGVLALLVVVAVGVVYLVAVNYDYNAFKPRIVEAVRNATGRQLTLEGDIGLKFGLQPSLVVESVAFQNAAWGSAPQMARLDRLELKLALLPLLRRHIDIRHLILVRPEILLETDAQGRSNLDFGTTAAPAGTAAADAPAAGAPQLPDLAFGKLRVDQGTFILRNGQTGQTLTVRLESLLARGGTGAEPLEVGLKGRYNDIDLEATLIGGPLADLLDPAASWPLDLTAGAPETTLTVKGTVQDAPGVKGIALTIGVQVADLAKLGQTLKSAVPQTDLPALDGSLDLSATVNAADRDHIAISGLDLKADTPEATLAVTGAIADALAMTGADLTVALTVPALDKLVERARPLLPADRPLPPIAGALDLSAVVKAADRSTVAVDELKLDLTTPEATLALSGAVANALAVTGIEVDARLDVPEIAKLGERFQLAPLPVSGPVQFASHVSVRSMTDMAAKGLSLRVAGNDVSGEATVRMTGGRPFVTAALTSGTLDLRPFLGTGDTGEAPAAASVDATPAKQRVFPDTPLPLDPLKMVDADVNLAVDRLLLPKVAMEQLSVAVKLADGHLRVTPLKAAVGGGTLDGRLDAKAVGRNLDVVFALTVDQLDMGDMLKKLDITKLLEGTVDADIDLTGRGASVAGIMAGLNGHTQVMVDKGVIYNKQVNVLGIELISTLLKMINPFAEKNKNTLVNCMVSRFDIEKGLATSTALVMDTDMMSLAGAGTLDLSTEKLDFALDPAPKKGVGTSGIGKVGLGVGELAKPFKLTGTLAKPGIGLDVGKAALTVGKALGGMALTGGASGILAALASGTAAEVENPCLAAIEAAASGKAAPADQSKTAADPVSKTTEAVKGTVSEGLKDVGGKLKGLFGD